MTIQLSPRAARTAAHQTLAVAPVGYDEWNDLNEEFALSLASAGGYLCSEGGGGGGTGHRAFRSSPGGICGRGRSVGSGGRGGSGCGPGG